MKKNEALFTLITTFILIVAWILFSILHSAVSSTISDTLSVQITAISPTFNTKVIETVKKRVQTSPVSIEALPTPTPASNSARIVLSPTPSTPPLIPTIQPGKTP